MAIFRFARPQLSIIEKPMTRKVNLTVPRVNRLLLIYDPSFLRKPVVSVLELSEPARSIRFCKFNKCLILDQCIPHYVDHHIYTPHAGRSRRFQELKPRRPISKQTEKISVRTYKLGECDIVVCIAFTSRTAFYCLRM